MKSPCETYYAVALKHGFAVGASNGPALFYYRRQARVFKQKLKEHDIKGRVVKVAVKLA